MGYKLTIRDDIAEAQLGTLPKYGIEHDYRFFDVKGLVGMYGEVVVREFFTSRKKLQGGGNGR